MKSITVAVFNYNQPEFTYYSVLNIKKILKEYNPIIKIFDARTERSISNHLDDVTVIHNNHKQIFDYSIEYNEAYTKFINYMLEDCKTDELMVVLPQVFINENIKCEIENNKKIVAFNNLLDIGLIIFNRKFIEKTRFNNYNELEKYVLSNVNKNYNINSYCIKSDGSDIVEFLYTNSKYWKSIYEDVIVSLTTFKGRINDKTTEQVLNALLNQQTRYNYQVVLVLSEEEFNNKESIPEYLKNLLNKYLNFEILWTYKNTRPLKKLDPTMEKYPELPIITLDDDDLVFKDMVENVVNEHRKDPYKVLGSMIEQTVNFIKWVAGVRLWPPKCLYNFPLSDYYEYYDGILDDNFNAMRCAFKMTPVRGMPQCSEKNNQTNLKLTTEYENTNWNYYYKRFIINHLNEIPEELYYQV